MHVRSPREAVGSGIGLVPEDRKRQGLVLGMPVRNNITMASVRQISGAFGFIRKKREKEIAEGYMSQLGIKARSGDVETADLSGGNQQKVALAKWLNSRCKVLLLDEPTRGIDIGAKVEIYQLISGLAGSGLGIVLVSSEMMEIIGLCDRVLVVSEGRISGELSKPDITEENIMRLAVARPLAG
jgi:ribose transport system ATP-binding protein